MSAIATADFVVTGVASNGYIADDTNVHMELQESNMFKYGNGTCVIMTIGNRDNFIDTRYDVTLKRDGSNFKEWAYDYIRDYVDSELDVKAV